MASQVQINLRFRSQNHEISVPGDAPLSFLMDEITDLFNIPVDSQKLIFKGRPLDAKETSISNYSIDNGAKLLLLASSGSSLRAPLTQSQTSITDSMENEPHKSIISRGVPNGALESCPFQTVALTNHPFAVYNKIGVPSELSIESDALFIKGNNGDCERIFLTDITKVNVVPLPSPYDGYFAYGIQSKQGQSWVYFLPMQYRRFFRYFLQTHSIE